MSGKAEQRHTTARAFELKPAITHVPSTKETILSFDR